MTRPHRFTVRLSATELSAVKKYANRIHAIPSVALRFLIAKALGGGKKSASTSRSPNKGLPQARHKAVYLRQALQGSGIMLGLTQPKKSTLSA